MSPNSVLPRLPLSLFFFLAFAVLLAQGGAVSAWAQSTFYVDDDALTDPSPGDPSSSNLSEDGSAAIPFDAIQEAIDVAENGDTVLVKIGTYLGEGNRDLDFGGRLITVRSEYGADTCTIDCTGEGRAFNLHNGETSAAVVSGFTIRSGYAYEHEMGNDLGGAIRSVGTSVVFEDCVITECEARQDGGGIYVEGGAPTIRRCTIKNNLAKQAGGGIRAVDSSPVIENCSITGNETGFLGGYGAGVSCDGGAPLISDCNISNNSAYVGRAAGVFLGAGGRISGSVIHSNTCDDNDAGGIDSRGDVTLEGCTITENQGIDGAGIFHEGGTLTVVNCVIARNHGLNTYGDASGAAIEFGGPVIVINSTIMQNPAYYTDHSGYSQLEGLGENLTISNSIIWELESVSIPPGALIEYSCVTGGWEGTGNIDSDPKFIDAEGGIYHLAGDSPCINAGSNEVEGLPELDIFGADRIQAGRVDIGAYESSFGMDNDDHEPCPSDLDALFASLCGMGVCWAAMGVAGLMCITRLMVGSTHRRKT